MVPMPRRSNLPGSDDHIAPLSQKQEDLLLELFLQLPVQDRKKVIKLCRDLLRDAGEHQD